MTKLQIAEDRACFARCRCAAGALPRRPSRPDVGACLITKTDTNPFFVKMKEGAQAKADELGVEAHGAMPAKIDGDNEGQVAAMEVLHRRRRQGHPAGAVRQRGDRRHGQEGARRRHPGDRARHAARPDRRRRRHLRHRQLQGRRADRRLGQGARSATRPRTPRSPILDLSPAQPTVDVLRDQGFMQGFGIDLGDPEQDRRRERRRATSATT